MITLFKRTVIAAAALAVASTASASPISLSNTRPASANVVAGEPGLQSLVNSILGPGIDVMTDQSAAALFGVADHWNGIIATLAFEYSGNSTINGFGLWSGEDTNDLTHVSLFNGAATGIGSGSATRATQAGVSWNDSGNQMTIVGNCLLVNCGAFEGIDPLRFGFYLQVGSAGTRFYTADQLNSGGSARTLAFQESGTANWALGFEDWTDGDANDGVLGIQGLAPAPVPEPATILLMATGIGGVLIRRRRAAKAAAVRS